MKKQNQKHFKNIGNNSQKNRVWFLFFLQTVGQEVKSAITKSRFFRTCSTSALGLQRQGHTRGRGWRQSFVPCGTNMFFEAYRCRCTPRANMFSDIQMQMHAFHQHVQRVSICSDMGPCFFSCSVRQTEFYFRRAQHRG